jgi:cytochrome c2
MPDFGLTDDQITALVNALLGGSKKNLRRSSEQPLAVHFEAARQERQDVFSIRCGSCHRMLTRSQGLLGSGDIGPNLSGLLSEYYPATFGTSRRWTVEGLRRWLKNPRQVRPNTTMRPVNLDQNQMRELEALFSESFP